VDTVFSERTARAGADGLGARLRAPVWKQVEARMVGTGTLKCQRAIWRRVSERRHERAVRRS
jgi:hypothetical protein